MLSINSPSEPKAFHTFLFQPNFLGGSVVKNMPANARDTGLVPGQEDSLEKGMAIHSSNPAWEIQWTEEAVAKSQT